MTSMKATLFLALVASAAGVIIRGPNVTYDTFIRAGTFANTNYQNHLTVGGWDGPFSINATSQVISGVTDATCAVLIKFDLSSIVGATLVPDNPVWLNYFVSDAGNPASLRELTVPWDHVCTRRPRRRALPTQPSVAPWLRPLPADASLSAPPRFRQSTVTWTNLPFASYS